MTSLTESIRKCSEISLCLCEYCQKKGNPMGAYRPWRRWHVWVLGVQCLWNSTEAVTCRVHGGVRAGTPTSVTGGEGQAASMSLQTEAPMREWKHLELENVIFLFMLHPEEATAFGLKSYYFLPGPLPKLLTGFPDCKSILSSGLTAVNKSPLPPIQCQQGP